MKIGANDGVIITRYITVKNAELLNMLEFQATRMLIVLTYFGIDIPDGNFIYIWVKEYNKRLYPKIEFDYNNQELQYDMTVDGNINEVFFKQFVDLGNGGQPKRINVEKSEADPMLQKIDNILRVSPELFV